MERRAFVVGGSLGGLTAALLLHERGFTVSLYERSAQLADRGAGIVAHPESLRYLLERGLADLDEVSLPGGNLRYLDREGGLAWERPSRYRFTSWYALYTRLLARLPSYSMHFAHALRDFDADSDGVTVRFASGAQERCDLLVCADGIASTARQLLLPDVAPMYSGYIGWRGTVPMRGLPPRLRGSLGGQITYQLLDSGHALAYPIPGSSLATSNGGEYLNWIWYRRIEDGPERVRVMTDRNGWHHELSVPPGEVASSVESELRYAASTLLADDLAALVDSTTRLFIQSVVDVDVPRMAFGRACLVGDAAFVVRPHAAAGTAKAAADGWSLADALDGADDIAAALMRWQPGQLQLGRQLLERSRHLGETQFRGEWVPGDRSLLFGLRAPGDSCFDGDRTSSNVFPEAQPHSQ
jgi:2,6-dihydroxypyridine 3-monooxygenase